MLRSLTFRAGAILKQGLNLNKPAVVSTPFNQVRNSSSNENETDEEFDRRYEAYFNRKDIDSWELRKAMDDLISKDLIPEPFIIIAAMRACRRLNDYAIAIRFLEAVKHQCGPKVGEIYPYLLGEIQPVLTELGILTPEEMGYDKPELFLEPIDEM